MKMRKPACLAAALLILGLSSASATGAGGLLFGLVQPGWNPEFLPEAASRDIEYAGGFGYGVGRDGFLVGGFGLAFLDYDFFDEEDWIIGTACEQHIAGGIGGLIVGSRIYGDRTIHFDLAARLGLGGAVSFENAGGVFEYSGYALVYAEPYAELGLGLTPWLHLCAVLSYPLIGNFIPGKPFEEVSVHTPSLGIALSFGEFDPRR